MAYRKKIANAVTVCGDTAFIDLGGGASAVIDADDADRVRPFSWRTHSGYVYAYVRADKRYHKQWLHRLITDAPDGMLVDHVNGDTRDNRKANLRLCTFRQNRMNSRNRTKPTPKSGHTGVYAVRGQYIARVHDGDRVLNIGSFDDADAAAAAHRWGLIAVRGRFAAIDDLPVLNRAEVGEWLIERLLSYELSSRTDRPCLIEMIARARLTQPD